MNTKPRADNDACPNEVRRALQEVLAYIWDDEKRDFEACSMKEDSPAHVFLRLKTLQEWLAETSPETYSQATRYQDPRPPTTTDAVDEKTYNGWSNYETWLVALWLDNERGSYDYWREQAAKHRNCAPHSEQVNSGIWTVAEAAAFHLADDLRDETHEAMPLTEASLFADLLRAALDEVDWQDIAEHYLADLHDEQQGPLESEEDR